MKADGNLPLSKGILDGDRRKSKRFPVFNRVGVICNSVGTAEGTVMNRFEQIRFA